MNMETPKQITDEEAIIAIKIVMQEIASMGANDHEMYDLQSLIKRLKEREISVEEAVTLAVHIRDQKYADH